MLLAPSQPSTARARTDRSAPPSRSTAVTSTVVPSWLRPVTSTPRTTVIRGVRSAAAASTRSRSGWCTQRALRPAVHPGGRVAARTRRAPGGRRPAGAGPPSAGCAPRPRRRPPRPGARGRPRRPGGRRGAADRGRACCSSTRTSSPRRASRRAAVRPTGPAPTTTTGASDTPSVLPTPVRGRVAAGCGSPVTRLDHPPSGQDPVSQRTVPLRTVRPEARRRRRVRGEDQHEDQGCTAVGRRRGLEGRGDRDRRPEGGRGHRRGRRLRALPLRRAPRHRRHPGRVLPGPRRARGRRCRHQGRPGRHRTRRRATTWSPRSSPRAASARPARRGCRTSATSAPAC